MKSQRNQVLEWGLAEYPRNEEKGNIILDVHTRMLERYFDYLDLSLFKKLWRR